MGRKLLHKKTVSKDYFKEDEVKKSNLEKCNKNINHIIYNII
jgi:hypothetical protein